MDCGLVASLSEIIFHICPEPYCVTYSNLKYSNSISENYQQLENKLIFQLAYLQMDDMLGWGITNTDDAEVREAGTTIAVLDVADSITDTSTSMYWTAPPSYLGNKVIY